MNISLPETLRSVVADEIQLETLLLEALQSPVGEMTAQDWTDIRQEVRALLAQRKQDA